MATTIAPTTGPAAGFWQTVQRDPRWLIAAFLTLFAALGQIYLGFFQEWSQVLTAMGTAVAAEVLLARLIRKQWINPLSGYIAGMGMGLLLSSYELWPYAVASLLAIGSKYVFRLGGRHIFNPSNFGLVVLLVLLPDYAVSTAKQWTAGLEMLALILALGLLVCWRVGRLDVVVAFVLSFLVLAYGRHYFLHAPLLAAVGPLMGAGLQLFTFFMITDPKTAPATRRGRIAYGMLIALLDAMFRVARIPNAPFYSLFITCVVTAVLIYWFQHQKTSSDSAGSTVM